MTKFCLRELNEALGELVPCLLQAGENLILG
jgi:hypothetical protein